MYNGGNSEIVSLYSGKKLHLDTPVSLLQPNNFLHIDELTIFPLISLAKLD